MILSNGSTPDASSEASRPSDAQGPAPWRSAAYDWLERQLTWPMLVLSVLLIPVLLLPEIYPHLSGRVRGVLTTLDWLIWGAFLIEYLTKLAVAPARGRYVRTHVPDLVLVAVPMLRPIRVLRSVRALRALRLTRLGAVATRTASLSRAKLASRAALYVLAIAVLGIVLAAVLMLDAERHARNATIHSFSDALWWAMTTVTTVGYGDRYPVTGAGRAIAAVLMVVGIAAAGVVTASIAAWLVKVTSQQSKETEESLLAEKVAELTAQLAALTARLEHLDVRTESASANAGGRSALIDLRKDAAQGS